MSRPKKSRPAVTAQIFLKYNFPDSLAHPEGLPFIINASKSSYNFYYIVAFHPAIAAEYDKDRYR
jgi:hypothetical protein